jgi:hypothetical protein
VPISKSEDLFSLIKSLDKSEKRAFRLYANRMDSNKYGAFVQLFDILDKLDHYDEATVLKKFRVKDKTHYSNVKRHLYSQVLKSLRTVHTRKDTEILVRESLDFAKILYGKGFYLQSLKIIDKIKPVAKEAQKTLLFFEILEFQKLIESRHITRSRKVQNKVEKIIDETDKLKEIISSTSEFLNLSLRIQGLYIKFGYVKSEKDQYLIRDYFQSNLPRFDAKKLSFYESVLLQQSFVWYNQIMLRFNYSYKHAITWVKHFDEKPIMKQRDPALYFRGLHYSMTSAYYLRSPERFRSFYYQMINFYNAHETEFLDNTKILYLTYKINGDFNKIFLEGSYTEGVQQLPSLEENILGIKAKLDPHRYSTYKYKMGWVYFGAGMYSEAIDQFNEILNTSKVQLRRDLVSYAKLMSIISHLQLKHFAYVLNEIKNVKRSFQLNEEKNDVVEVILELLRKLSNSRSLKNSALIDEVEEKLILYRSSRLSSRPFIYFDFVNWIRALKSGVNIESKII